MLSDEDKGLVSASWTILGPLLVDESSSIKTIRFRWRLTS